MHRAAWLPLLCALAGAAILGPPARAEPALSPEQIIAALRKPSSSTGNIADAVEEATGARGFMYHDMKPVFKAKIVGRAATAVLRPVLKHDARKYPSYAQETADRVVALIEQYDEKESKMIPIIEREKSMLKALEIYQRY